MGRRFDERALEDTATRARRGGVRPTDAVARASGPDAVLRLQRAAGNRAVQALLRPTPSGGTAQHDAASAQPALPKVRVSAAGPVVQRTAFKFTAGKWAIQGLKTVDEPFGQPHRIRWPWKLNEGDTFDNETGCGTRTVNKKVMPFDLMADRVGGDRRDYGLWFEDRRDTAYTHTTADPKAGGWGPHTVAHITKRGVAESGALLNTEHSPWKVKEGTGLLPSPGQNRRLAREHEQRTGVAIPVDRKRALDKAYKRALKARKNVDVAEPNLKKRKRQENAANQATADAIELSMFSTYSHGVKASSEEIGGKGENRQKGARDVRKLIKLKKADPLPALETFDPGGSTGFRKRHRKKYLRDLGSVAAGHDEDVSDFELSSDEEYPEPEPPTKKRKKETSSDPVAAIETVPAPLDDTVLPDTDLVLASDADPTSLT